MKFYSHKRTLPTSLVSSDSVGARLCRQHNLDQSGFTILETTIALFLMLIVALGSASLFSFSIYNNSAGSDRAVSLALAQQALELLRSASFTKTTTDVRLNAGTFTQNGVLRDGRSFNVTKIIDDDPATAAVDVNPHSTLKSIKIIVRSESIGKGWASGAAGTITLISQRTRAD
jgi:Tfp pilus assembly protein PilV